jgi:c-di-GMP-binding flagellar brake protein YcgR
MHRQQPIAKKKVYLNKNKEGHLNCGQCGKAHKLSAKDSESNIAKGVNCSCSCFTDVYLEQRQNFRKDVECIGTFEKIYPDSSEMGKIIVENISHTGMKLRTVTRNHLKKDDVIQIRFALKGNHNSIIAENGIVRFVNGLCVGIEFQHLSEHAKKLIGFHLMQFAAAPIPSGKQEIAGSSNTRESSDSRLVSNPFGISVDKIPVSLKGDLTSFGLHAILKTLSVERKSGILQLARGRARRAICFKEGNVVAATGNREFQLGQLLFDEGLICREKLEDALKKVNKSGKRLGEMLLKQGYIDKCILKGLIQHQIQKVIHALSHWREGHFEYRDCSVEFDDRGITGANDKKTGHISNKIPKTEQRREHSRVEVSWPVSIFSSQGPLEGEVRNISLTGALIRCLEIPDLDEAVRLGIEIGEHRHVIFATAEAVRLDIQDYDSDYYSYLLGVHFTEISEKDRRFLASRFLH